MDDFDDFDDDDEGGGNQLVTVLARPSERSAEDAARSLVEHGLGAVVEVNAAPSDEGPRVGGFAVRVMPHEVERACEVLGVEVPSDVAAALHADDKEPTPPWKRILLLWVIAMLTIPLFAGLAAYWLFSR